MLGATISRTFLFSRSWVVLAMLIALMTAIFVVEHGDQLRRPRRPSSLRQSNSSPRVSFRSERSLS